MQFGFISIKNTFYLTFLTFFFIFIITSGSLKAGERSLRIKGDHNFPPYEFINNRNSPDGFSVDIMRAISKDLKLDITIEMDEWHKIRDDIEQGKTDALIGMIKTAERDKIIDFSNPYLIVSYAVFVRKGSAIESLKDAYNKTIVVENKELGHDYIIENKITNKLILKKSYKDVLMSLSAGEGDCALISRLQGTITLKNNKIQNIEPVGPPIIQREYCFAVAEGNTSLLATLNEGLRIIKISGEYDRIYDKWFGAYKKSKQGYRILKSAFLILGPLLLIIGLALLWSLSLKRKVALRTEELRESREKLRLSEERYDLAMSGANEGIWDWDIKNDIVYFDKRYFTMAGYEPYEFPGTFIEFENRIHPEDYSITKSHINDYLTGKKESYEVEFRFLNKEGNYIWIRSRGKIVARDKEGKATRFIGTHSDITKRKLAEINALEKEQFIISLINAIPTPVFFKDKNGLYQGCNRAFTEITGKTSEELQGKTVMELWPGEFATDCQRKDLELLQNTKYQTYEYSIKDRYGRIRQVVFERDIYRDVQGEIAGIIGAFLDITENKKAEEEQSRRLERVERQNAALIELTMNTAHSEGNLESSINFITKLMADTLQVERVSVWFFNFDHSQIECMDLFIRNSESHKKEPPIRTSDYPNYFKDLNNNWILSVDDTLSDYRTGEFKDNYLQPRGISSLLDVAIMVEGKMIGIIFHEHIGNNRHWTDDEETFARAVSDQLSKVYLTRKRKKTEEQLAHSSKMDAIGQLAGGVAHDFNNMLGGIMTAAQLLKSPGINLNDKGLKYIDIILRASSRAADLTSRLLAFGRKGKISSTTINLSLILEDTVAILRRTVDKKIQITEINKADNFIVTGDSSGLQNAFMNIGINASHAIPDGGEIIIKTENINLDINYCDTSPFEIEPGEYIKIEFTDTGIGIPEENLKKIFEPFYTTKEIGKGTGLGLAAVYGTVQDHHGAINVYSKKGAGSTFQIFLPCADEDINSIPNETKIITGSGLILLTDDEEIIRITGKAMLEEMGYNVLLAEDGAEAIKIFKQHHSEIDLVILDMIMPKMDGKETFFKMKEIDQNCRIIITSGFAKSKTLYELKKSGLDGVIRKPYSGYDLSLIISQALRQTV